MNTRELQVALFRLGFDPGIIDGADGPHTHGALVAYQVSCALSSADTFAAIEKDLALLPLFVESKYLNRAHRPQSTSIDNIVIHTMESAEKPGTALNVANWFANKSAPTYPAPQASAHYCVDNKQIVQCVLECDVAWHAPGANHNGIGIEHSGIAAQSDAQWHDDYSKGVLKLSARLVAKLCLRFSIPVQRLSVGELRAGGRGICGHIDCTNAFSNGRGHTDPGPNFPWDEYIAMVKAEMVELASLQNGMLFLIR